MNNDDYIPDDDAPSAVGAPEAPPELPASSLEPAALLPDGIGLSLEAVRALLAQKHETVVPKDDPMLMVVTILNACLAEQQKLQERHAKGLAKLMAEKTDSYVKGVQAATDSLAEGLSASSVQGIRKVFDEHAARLNVFRQNVIWTGAIVAVSALVNVAVFVLR